MSRRRWLVTLLLGLFVVPWAGKVLADNHLDVDTMKAGLRTVTDEENDFVKKVVHLANKGVLQPGLVESTFLWARKKPKYKFQYFKRAMIARAADAGVVLK